MRHDDLYDKVLKAMGGVVPMEFREEFARWHQAQGSEIYLRYDWIKKGGFYNWLIVTPEVEWHDGTEGLTVWIEQFGRVGH